MNFLEEKIIKHASVTKKGMLAVDNFLNHQIDISLMNEIGKAFSEMFNPDKIDKIITIEPSGIAPAVITAQYFGNIPVVFAKRRKSVNTPEAVHTADVFSPDPNRKHKVIIEKKMILRYDRVLLMDDILANGNSMHALIDLVEAAGADVRGVGVCIERGELDGGKKLRDLGYDVKAIATTKSVDFETSTVTFK